jgi:lipoprotein-anchoring transpeptidase ErfK/SrfK
LATIGVRAQHGTPFELRDFTPTIQDADPGREPAAEEKIVPAAYRRQPVFYRTNEAPGTIIIDTSRRFLYLVQPNHSCATASASDATASSGTVCSRSPARRSGRTGRHPRK